MLMTLLKVTENINGRVKMFDSNLSYKKTSRSIQSMTGLKGF